MKEWAVKVKFDDEKIYRFVASQGRTSRLRIHALTFDREDADRVAKIVFEDNGGIVVDSKVVRFWKD